MWRVFGGGDVTITQRGWEKDFCRSSFFVQCMQWKLYNSVLGGGCHCLKAVNCHLSMSGSEWSLESPDSFLPKKMRGGRTREEEDVIGLAMHDLQQGCS